MRYDSFIIWGNGIQYVEDIVSIIREHPDFDIVFLSWYNINEDMYTFIKKVYECDDAPWSHLKLKTQYLLNSPKKIFFILIRNFNPQISNKQWAKEQCQTVCDLKTKIRAKYNPRSNNLRECGPPLPPGVSHQHVIHASDYEAQVEHDLQIFGMKNLDWYKRYDNSEYFIPYHLDINLKKIHIQEYNIDDLKVDIIGKGLVPVIETPYYKYLMGEKNEMIEYSKHIGYTLKEDHYPDSINRLDRIFKLGYLNKLGQKCYPIIQGNRVLDGGHRLAVMKKRGYEKVECIRIK